MEKIVLNMEDAPRILSFPLRIKNLGYIPEDFHSYRGSHKTIIIGLRLSSAAPQAIEKIDGERRVFSFPHVVCRIPGKHYETSIPLPWETIYFSYSPDLLPVIKTFGVDLSPQIWKFELTPSLSKLVKDILDFARRVHDYGVADKIDLLCYELLTELVIARRRKREAMGRNEIQVRKIASYIQLHHAESFSLDELIRKHGLSRRTFFRCWGEKIPLSPSAYVSDLKIKEACRLLAESDLRVYEIAECLNYRDPVYFYRTFKKNTGRTPRQYRLESSRLA